MSGSVGAPQQAPESLLGSQQLSLCPLQTSEGATMPVSVWTSTLSRTIQTAEGLPFPKLRWKVLDEIQAGVFDGWTYKEIEEQKPQEFAARKADKLRYRWAPFPTSPIQAVA